MFWQMTIFHWSKSKCDEGFSDHSSFPDPLYDAYHNLRNEGFDFPL